MHHLNSIPSFRSTSSRPGESTLCPILGDFMRPIPCPKTHDFRLGTVPQPCPNRPGGIGTAPKKYAIGGLLLRKAFLDHHRIEPDNNVISSFKVSIRTSIRIREITAFGYIKETYEQSIIPRAHQAKTVKCFVPGYTHHQLKKNETQKI